MGGEMIESSPLGTSRGRRRVGDRAQAPPPEFLGLPGRVG